MVYMYAFASVGDFAFDPKSWPDVPGMMKTLESYGMRVMVSAWPFLSKGSSTRATVVNHKWAMTVQGTSTPVGWDDNNCVESGGGPCAIYDPTQKAAREYIWSRLREGYYQ
jgi:alpha-D-xyloside xylohydrolase